eukprot:gene17292-biopygen6252
MGIHKSRTTAYYPQCDGLVERQNRTIQNILSSFVSQHRDDWDNWVSLAVYAYNTSSHESTGYRPYEMVFGRDPRTLLEIDLPLKNPSSQSDYMKSARNALHSIKVSAQKQLEQSRNKQAPQFHSSTTWTPFAPGTSVWFTDLKKEQWSGCAVPRLGSLGRSGLDLSKLCAEVGYGDSLNSPEEKVPGACI